MFEYIFRNVPNRNTQDVDGDTPLHVAAENGRLKMCQLVIQSREDLSLENMDGNMPFHLAAESGFLDICALFLEKLVCKSPENKKRKTPLMLADKMGHSAVVDLIQNYSVKRAEPLCGPAYFTRAKRFKKNE